MLRDLKRFLKVLIGLVVLVVTAPAWFPVVASLAQGILAWFGDRALDLIQSI